MIQRKTVRDRAKFLKGISSAAIICLLGALLGACGADSEESGSDAKMSVSIYGKHASYWPLYIAEDQGYFEDESLTVELLVPQAGSGITQSVLSGSVQVGIGTPDGFINAALQGQKVKAYASLQNNPVGSLMVSKDLNFPDDIRGSIVAVSNEKSGDAYLTARILEDAGLAKSEYSMLSAGGTPDRAASLVSGGVTAALLGQPQDFSLMAQGYKRQGFADEVVPDFAWQWISAESSWADKNPETLSKFLNALHRATAWWYDPANEKRAVELLVAEGKVEQDVAQATYDLWQERELFQRDLVPSAASYDGIIEFMMSVDLVKSPDEITFDEFVDLTVVEKVTSE